MTVDVLALNACNVVAISSSRDGDTVFVRLDEIPALLRDIMRAAQGSASGDGSTSAGLPPSAGAPESGGSVGAGAEQHSVHHELHAIRGGAS